MEYIKCKTQRQVSSLIKKHKLDRRRKYFAYNGMLTYSATITEECTGCVEYGESGGRRYDGGGCAECGYTGKRRNSYPQIVEIKS